MKMHPHELVKNLLESGLAPVEASVEIDQEDDGSGYVVYEVFIKEGSFKVTVDTHITPGLKPEYGAGFPYDE